MAQTDFDALLKAQAAIFVVLGGAVGVRTLLTASTLLDGLSRDQTLDDRTRYALERIVAAADANVVAELEAAEPA
jgi:hypothetical protein